jgi:hypothetical protein
MSERCGFSLLMRTISAGKRFPSFRAAVRESAKANTDAERLQGIEGLVICDW